MKGVQTYEWPLDAKNVLRFEVLRYDVLDARWNLYKWPLGAKKKTSKIYDVLGRRYRWYLRRDEDVMVSKASYLKRQLLIFFEPNGHLYR